MYGWLIYTAAEAERNRIYIEKYMSRAAETDVRLELVISDRLLFGIKNNKRFFGTDILPDFAINRSRNAALGSWLEKSGVRVFNNSEITRIFNDKQLTHEVLFDLGIPMADSVFATKNDFDFLLIKDFPIVVKSVSGHGGTEVFMAKSQNDIFSAVKRIDSEKLLIQRLVSDVGRDLRVYVLGKKVVASVLRSSENDFRSNFCLGGSASLYELNEKEKALVDKTTAGFDFGLVGIDFVFDDGEPLLNEIEDVVGARMLYSLTDIDIAAEYLDYIVSNINK